MERVSRIAFIAAQIGLFFWLDIGQHGRMAAALILPIALLFSSFRFGRKTHFTTLLIVGGLFAVIGAEQFTRNRDLLNAPELFAECLLLIQALELIAPKRTTATNYLPGLGAMSTSLALIAYEEFLPLSALRNIAIGFWFALVFVLRPDLPQLWFSDSQQRHKARAILLMLILAWILGAFAEQELLRQLPTLQQAVKEYQGISFGELDRIMVRQNASFVSSVGLSNVTERKLAEPDGLVFSIGSSSDPGYVRTLSFENYEGDDWFNTWDKQRPTFDDFRRVSSERQWPQELANLKPDGVSNSGEEQPVYRIPKALGPSRQPTKTTVMNITVPGGRGTQVPIPQGTSFIVGELRSGMPGLFLDMHDAVFRGSFDNSSFACLVDGSRTTLGNEPEEYLQRLVQLPAVDAAYLRDLSKRICGNRQTTAQKASAIQNYFTSNYRYSLNVDIEPKRTGRSRLRTFLEDRPAAHCEYFATATALLLRAQAIPARLSTGYLVYELDDDGEDYLARNENAHAWVEAFDRESQRWITVESTPGTADYIRTHQHLEASASDASSAAANANAGGLRLDLLLQELVGVVREWVLAIINWRFSWLIPTSLAIWALIQQSLKFRRRRERSYVSRPVQRADRLAKRAGLIRQPNETCEQFAVRLSELGTQPAIELSVWYANYAQTRYLPP